MMTNLTTHVCVTGPQCVNIQILRQGINLLPSAYGVIELVQHWFR